MNRRALFATIIGIFVAPAATDAITKKRWDGSVRISALTTEGLESLLLARREVLYDRLMQVAADAIRADAGEAFGSLSPISPGSSRWPQRSVSRFARGY